MSLGRRSAFFVGLVLASVACQRADRPAEGSSAEDVRSGRTFDEGAPSSRGFRASPGGPAEPMSPAQLEKKRALMAAERDRAALPMPEAWRERRIPDEELGLDLYVDGELARSVPRAELDTVSGPLAPLVGSVLGEREAVSALVKGTSGAVWTTPQRLPALQLRKNAKGQLKLEPMGRKKRRWKREADAMPKAEQKLLSVRDVHWVEIRTVGSEPVEGEPRRRSGG